MVSLLVLIGVIMVLTSSRIDTAYLEFNPSDPSPDEDDPGDRVDSNTTDDISSGSDDSEWNEEDDDDYN